MNKIYFYINPDFYLVSVYAFHISKILILINYIYTKHNIEIVISNNLNNIDKDGIIIPNEIEEQKQLYFEDYKNVLVNHPKLYEVLDDKEKCYDLIKQIDNIPIINTFKNEYYLEDDFSQFLENNKKYDFFIFKGKTSVSSEDIFIFKKSDVVNKYKTKEFQDYIIQPYLDNYKLHSINLLAENGKILECLITKQPNNYDKDNLFGKNFFKVERSILNKNDPYFMEIYNISNKIVEKTNYSGFIEIEFLCNQEVLLLEINPRISGHVLNINDDLNLIYVDILLLKYINVFNNLSINNKAISNNLNEIKKKRRFYNHIQLLNFILKFISISVVIVLLIVIAYKFHSRDSK